MTRLSHQMRFKALVKVVGFVGAYFGLSSLGVPLTIEAIGASPIWLPTGLSLAAILLFGMRFWPVVALAVAASMATRGIMIPVAAVLGLSKAAEVVLAAYLMRGPGRFTGTLESVRNVLALVLGGAFAASVLGALGSTTILCLSGLAPWTRFLELASTWWLGDAMGVLIAVPAILTFVTPRRWAFDRSAAASIAGLAFLLLATCEIAFGVPSPSGSPLAYLPFPFIFWTTLRFGVHGAAISSCLVSLHATVRTLGGFGPFARTSPVESLVLLETFLGVMVVTSLIMGAVIAERRKAAQALRESQKRYALASSAGSAGVWDWDLTTNEIYVDPVLKQILGYDDHEIPNHIDEWGKLVHPEDTERVMAEATRHLDGEAPLYEVEHRMLHKDGSVRWFLARGEAQRDAAGRALRLTGADVDITQQKLTEDALERGEQKIREQLEELDRLYQTTPVGLCVIDRDLRYVRINERLAAMNGRPVDEHIGRTIYDILPDLAPKGEVVYRHVLESGEPVIDVEIRGTTQADPDSEHVWLASFYPLTDDEGKVRGVTNVVQDITARKEIERALKESDRTARAQLAELEHIYQTVPIGLGLMDAELRYVRINERLATMNGQPREEHIGRTLREVVPMIADEIEPKLRRVLDSGKPQLEELEAATAAWSGTALVGHYPVEAVDGEVQGVGVIVQDITPLKNAEKLQAGNYHVLELVAKGSSLSEVLNVLAENVETQTGCGCIVRLMDDGGGSVRLVAAPSLPESHDRAIDVLPVGSNGGTCGSAASRRESVVTPDITNDASWEGLRPEAAALGIRSFWSVPILSSSDEVLGTVGVFCDEPRSPKPVQKDVIENAAHLARVAIEHARAREAVTKSESSLRLSHEQIQHLAARLIAAQEEERRRVSRELHDGLNQQLAALSFEIGKLRSTVPEDRPAIRERLSELQDRAVHLIDDARRMSHELHPSMLEHLGLVAAVRGYCDEVTRRGDIRVRFDPIRPPEPVSPDVALCLFRVVQEGVRNAAKHSGADVVQVTLRGSEDGITLTIADDGSGFDNDSSNGGLGLVSMAERVRVIGGEFGILSNRQEGTRLEVRIPIHLKTASHSSAPADHSSANLRNS